tara:strand:- start:6519 stop:6755 length:237 start_codon:yes stop_codon:yes gene_type:complete
MHIVLDDGNLEDGCIRFCISQADGTNEPWCWARDSPFLKESPEGVEEMIKISIAVCDILLGMTIDERDEWYEDRWNEY